MGINIFLYVLIIMVDLYIATISFSFFATSKVNHFKFKHIYQMKVLLIFQSILAIIVLITGNKELNSIRWLCFTFAEYSMLLFAISHYKKRHFELLITSIYIILLLISTLMYSLAISLIITGILVLLCLLSKEEIVKKWFSVSFLIYGLVNIVPYYFGLTDTESILVGLIFTLHISAGVVKLYQKDKVDDELKKLLAEGKI